MAQIATDCTFIRYDLTPEELEAAVNLNGNTEMYIQNLLSMAAEEKINLAFTEENRTREAELAGAIIAYRQLLDHSRAVKEAQSQKIQSGNSQPPDGDPSGKSIFNHSV